MFNFSTITAGDTLRYLVQTYGPLFTTGATIITATVASFAAWAAMRSAGAAEKNVETSRLSMELSTRAYISIPKRHFVKPLAEGATPHIAMTFKNVGKTIAKFGQFKSHMQLVERELQSELPTEAEVRPGQFTCAPDQELILGWIFDDPLTAEQITQLQNEDLFLYYWGEFLYKDVFGHRHSTEWCIRYSPDAENNIAIHHSHNDMT